MRPMEQDHVAHIEDGWGRTAFRANDSARMSWICSTEFDLGDFIQASGEMFRTRTGEATLRVTYLRMLAKGITPLPAAKDQVVDGELVQHATLSEPELRYRQRYADLAVNLDVRKIFQARAATTRALREFLDQRDFVEVETPVLQPTMARAALSVQTSITSSNRAVSAHFVRALPETPAGRQPERPTKIGRIFA
jgi:lysyl-tRNA synthetase class 2